MIGRQFVSHEKKVMLVILCLFLSITACNPASNVPPKIQEKEWDLLVMGDSKTWGVGEQYAKEIEAEQGVKVTLTELPRENLPTSGLLDVLRTYDIFRKAARSAEVIVFVANPFEYTGTGFFETSQKFECSSEAMETYKTDLDAILDEIFALRKGKPTILRMLNYYSSSNNEWRTWGKYEEYKNCWKSMNEVIYQVSLAHKIPMADVYSVFNGTTHDEDPLEKGYLRSDGEHPSETGAKVIAESLSELGYEPLIPKR